MRNDPLARWADLFTDADARLFTLPADITALRSSVVALDAERARVAEHAPDPARARAELLRGYVTAARGGQDWPDPAPALDTERAAQAHRMRTDLLAEARAQLASEMLLAVDDHADALIVEHLRPAFDSALADLHAAARALPDDLSGDALLRAPDKVRKTWLGLDDVASRLSRLRRLAERLGRLRPVQHDQAGEFAAMRNLRQVWPLYQPGRTPPWPQDNTRLALLWQARNGCELWLPTSAERDAAWLEVHGAALERTRRARQAAGMVNAWGSGFTPSPSAA
jgi:hypothetical protein